MRSFKWLLLLGALGVAQALVQAQAQPAPAPGIQFSPCQLEDAAHFSVLVAECGTLEVAENPAAPAGRKIKLHIARVPAINRRKAEDPLFILAGGPGMAASTMYAGTAAAFARIQRNRDIVLVDQRGTGQSNALECSFDDEKLLRSTTAETEAETAR
jgi:pimeloyl-ACP methyl ester carboxylesterase